MSVFIQDMITKKNKIRIKKAMIEKGITQVKMASDLGVYKQQINNVLNGQVENYRLEYKIMKYLGITQ